jgi:type IV pilus assembly protein PilQ
MYFYRTHFIQPQELVDTVGNLLKLPGVTMKAFPRGHQVILEGSPEAIETALDAFAYFDVADAQVYVEARIVEITYDNDFEFGLSWLMDRDKQGPNTFFRGGAGTLNPPSFFQSQQPGNLPFQGVGAAFGFVGKAAEKYGLFDLTLQALQLNGTAEVLSRPSIVATEGVPAEVKTLQKTPIIQIRNATSNPSGETLLLETSYVETKIGLDVTAIFIGDGYVKMQVAPTVSTVTGFSVGNGGTSAPIISDRSAKTTVTLADGDTLVIGGLYTDSTLKDTAKVPFLGDIPGLGCLFTRTRDQKVKTELIFEITPHILRKRTDFKVISPPGEKERLEGAGGSDRTAAPSK